MEKDGALIGHVKLIAEVNIGFLKLSLVDTTLGVEVMDHLDGKNVEGGKVKVMAAVLNIDDMAVEKALNRELETLSATIHFHMAGHGCDHKH
jgi:hypothetical protein